MKPPTVQAAQEPKPAQEPDRTKKIRVFHSILSFLAQFPQGISFTNNEIPLTLPANRAELSQLRLSNAIANLAVTDTEVVAATVFTPKGVAILAWVRDQNPNDPEAVQDAQKPSCWGHESPYRSTSPRIVKATPPPGYPTASERASANMLQYLDEFLKRRNAAPEESSHLWVLANMLITLKGNAARRPLLFYVMKYIIAASHAKIRRRFKSPTSRVYWKSFKKINLEEINPEIVRASSQRPRYPPELKHDDILFHILQKPNNGVVLNFETEYPNIAAALKKEPTPESELFNPMTYKEYHRLFMRLMTQYRKNVRKIDDMTTPFVEDDLDLALNAGYNLLAMVKGRAFHQYLSTIASLLMKAYEDLQESDQHGRADSSEYEGPNQEGVEEGDPASPEVGTNLWDPKTPDAMASWKPFKSWIMIMLVQLDAADTLCSFVQAEQLRDAEIDVKLVYPPLVSNTLMTLEELLQEHIQEPNYSGESNTELLDFVKAGNMFIKHANAVREILKQWNDDKAKKIIKQILEEAREEDEEHSNQLNDSSKTIALCQEIQGLLNREPGDQSDLLAKFSALEQELMKRRQGLPFGEKTSFRGALHCEAGLASILDYRTRAAIQAEIEAAKGCKDKDPLSELLRETEGFTRVIGASKRCCPVCHYFLACLSLGTNSTLTSFVTPDFYSTVLPCTLPEWTPDVVVDRMNRMFGQLLREALVKQYYRSHHASSGSVEFDTVVGKIHD